MVLTEPSVSYRKIWEAALRAAAGPLSAYITPESYGLSVLKVTPNPDDATAGFEEELQSRLDFGRAIRCLELMRSLESELTSSYQHEIVEADRNIRGKLHVPRLIIARAAGRQNVLPIIQ